MVFSTISDCDMTPVVAMDTGRGARARPEGVRGVWRIRTPVESLLIALGGREWCVEVPSRLRPRGSVKKTRTEFTKLEKLLGKSV